MEEDCLEIYLRPTLDDIKEGMGFAADDDDVDEEALFQQGYETQLISIGDGDPLEVPTGYEAELPADESFYLLDPADDPLYKEEFEVYTLPAGYYRLDRTENIFWIGTSAADESFDD